MPAIAPASLSATKHLPHQTARPIGGRCMPVPDGTAADGTVPVPDGRRPGWTLHACPGWDRGSKTVGRAPSLLACRSSGHDATRRPPAEPPARFTLAAMRASQSAARAGPVRLLPAAALCLLAGAANPAPPGPAQDPEYIGTERCGACHADELAAWRGSHHDLAMQPATPQSVLADFAAGSVRHDGQQTRFLEQDGRFYVHTAGGQGDSVELRISHVFGVEPLQQYLVARPGGRLQALTLAWDTRPAAAGGGRWFDLYPEQQLAPGDPLHWSGLNQNWNTMCAECHSTRLRKGYSPDSDSFATRWAAIDVACEACHGPGRRHADWAASEPRPPSPDLALAVRLADTNEGRWEMNPATGNASRTAGRSSAAELHTCARCHSRRIGIVADPPPGKALLDTHEPALLEAGLYHADGQIDGEVYVYGSFLQSRMHAAGVTCSDCHDPHGLELRAEGAAVCRQCHAPLEYDSAGHHHHDDAAAGAPDCLACHMPGKHYMGVDHRRDHSLRVPRPDLAAEVDTPDACSGCHGEAERPRLAAAFTRWYPARAAKPHFGQAIAAARRGEIGAGRRLEALARRPAVPGIARATAVSLLPEYPRPGRAELLAGALGDSDGLVRLAAVRALAQSGQRLPARLLIPRLGDPRRAVRIAAARGLAPVHERALSRADQPAFQSALQAYIAAQRASAERAFAHVNLGGLYRDLGRTEQAEQAYRRALRLEPDSVQARVNLADLLRAGGRDDAAVALLRAGLEHTPEAAPLHHALGLALVRRGQDEAALEALARGSALAPANARFAYVHAVALHEAGQPMAAIARLEETHEQRPANREVLRALLAYQQQAGELAAALDTALTLRAVVPWDRSVARLVAELRAATGARRARE